MVINTVLLCFVYFVGVGLAVVVTKVVGIQVLSLGKKTKGSYYVNKKIGKGSMDEYRNQF